MCAPTIAEAAESIERDRRSVWRPRGLIVGVVAAIVAMVVTLIPGNVAAADPAEDPTAESVDIDVTDMGPARRFAVEMLGTSFPASSAAAAAALAGSEEDFRHYAESGRVEAQFQDVRTLVVTISAVGGPGVQARAKELLDASHGPEHLDQLVRFVESEWQNLQAEDDRAETWDAARAREGSSVKRAADRTIRTNTREAYADFVAEGLDRARRADARREVYELTRSELPRVREGAAEAIRVNTDTAIDGFLRYGQYVAAAQDAETMSISELVEMSISQANKAAEANSMAEQLANRAARASENARRAADRSKTEAEQANAAQIRAGNAAIAAGELANQSARIADEAVAASQEARIALQQTADALARAAAAAAQARAAASAAAARASAASRDASAARGARIAAQQARDAARAAQQSQEAYQHAERSAAFAANASQAAASAAGNADAAAGAAAQAANAAGVSEQAAAEARVGAARARAAAHRARAAAQKVDQLVARIRGLVARAKVAAQEAAVHADRAAAAAEDAARHAGNAEYAARLSGQYADDAAAAAEAADNAMDMAEEMAEAAVAIADDRLEAERAYLHGRATDERFVQDARVARQREREKKTEKLKESMKLLDNLEEPRDRTPTPDLFTGDLTLLRQSTVAAAQVGGPSVSNAARAALAAGTDEALKQYAVSGYPEAVDADRCEELLYWWATDTNEAIQNALSNVLDSDEETVKNFLEHEGPQLRIPDLKKRTYELRDSAGQHTRAAADAALLDGGYEALDAFVNGEYHRALWRDQIQEAYYLVDNGGPEVRAGAEAAIVGDRAGLDEFIRVEQYRRAAADEQRRAHDEHVGALLQQGRQAADLSAELASNAQASHEQALGSADRARQYADAAGHYAGQAREAERRAQGHVASAQGFLDKAKQHQARAHQAAASAEADASAAEAKARQAVAHATEARAAAQEASSSAAAARASAEAAGQDAALAAQASDEAFRAAQDLEIREQIAYQEALKAGAIDAEANRAETESFLETLRTELGPDAWQLFKDLVGITDIQDCVGGDYLSCLMVGLDVAGMKVFRVGITAAKNSQKILRMVEKVNDAYNRWQKGRAARKAHRVTKLDEAIAACRARIGGAAHRVPQAGGAVRVVPAVSQGQQPAAVHQVASCPVRAQPVVARYRRVLIEKLTPDELNVFMKWDKTIDIDNLRASDFDRIRDVGHKLPDSHEEIDKIIKSLKSKIEVNEINLTNHHKLNDVPGNVRGPKTLGLRSKAGNLRRVGNDDAHNILARFEKALGKSTGNDVRLNQTDGKWIQNIWEKISRGRPDISISNRNGREIKIEYDTSSSGRGLDHAMRALDANPDADVFLVEVTKSDLSPELLAVLNKNSSAMDDIPAL